MLSLTIHHNIHLTREQRYSLHEGQDVETVGFSVPVWFKNKTTSEPAKEVFCMYYLKNPKKDTPMQILENGYEIAIPFREGTKLNISDEEWRKLNRENPDVLDALYSQQIQEVSSLNLLDIKDGGNGGSMTYREHNKIKRGEQFLNIMHFICIETMETLLSSLSND